MKIEAAFEKVDSLTEALNRLAEALETAPATAPRPNPEQPAETKSEPAVTRDEVRQKFIHLAQAGKKPELKELLDEYGADNVSSLDGDVLDAIYARLEDIDGA